MSEKLTPAEAGKRGAQRRWGPPRRIHIGDLAPAQRELVLAAIEAERRKNTASQPDDVRHEARG